MSRMPIRKRFWSKVKKGPGCWEWQAAKNKAGYGCFFGPGKKQTTAHRIAYWLAVGEIPEGLLVLHKCDNPSCVRPDHLFVGTQSDNMYDKVRKGRNNPGNRKQKGERNNASKLTETVVREMRRLFDEEGVTQGQLMRIFKLGRSQVHAVVRRISWKHI